ncbi:MAG TPA: L-threonylcarbamoyladenylate synthase [Candidatus Polarisedimenticolia bacterium]|nr:L-threonylcarbamoyladenylate synthase [Candidatus Polarisedimenticolia bacterium]
MNETPHARHDPRDILTARALTVPLDPAVPDPRILLSAATIIRQGGVVAYPTETVYGLAADPFRMETVKRLGRLKGRDDARAMILLLPHPEAAFDLAAPEGPARRWFEALARTFWPGPLSIVLPARPGLNCPALGATGTVAVRVSSHPVARQLVRTVGAPITSTSANLTGEPPASIAQGIDPCLASRLDLILDGGPSPGGPPSTLVDLSGDRPIVLRLGSIAPSALSAILGFAVASRRS